MATVVLLGDTFNTTSGTHTVTATPAVGDYIVIVVANSGSSATTTCTDNNSSGVYSTVSTSTSASSANIMLVQVRTTAITAASSTVFTNAPGTTTGGGISVYAVRGIGLVGTTAVRSNGNQNNIASGTPAPVLSNTPLASSAIITAVFNATNPNATTARSSPAYTRDVSTGWATPTTGIATYHVASGETSATITYGGTSASAFGSVAVEIDATIQIDVTDSTAVTDLPFYFADTAYMQEQVFINLTPPPNQVNVTDSTAVADIAGRPDDTAIIFDTPIITIQSGPTNPTFTATDSTAVSDTPILNFSSSPVVSDSTAVSDTPKIEILSFIAVSDSTVVSDTPTLYVPISLMTSDSSIVSDVPAIAYTDDILLPAPNYTNGWQPGLKIIGP